MFVSIAVDPSSETRSRELSDLLAQYGFKRVQRLLWESATVSADTLSRLKRDLDKATDGFDKLRFFQFPMEGTLVLSSLKDKRWRRMVAVNLDNEENNPDGAGSGGGKTRTVQKPERRRQNRRK